MINVVKVKKGLDIKLKGNPLEVSLKGKGCEGYAIVPDNFDGITPKVIARVGDMVKAGTALVIDKNFNEIKLVSPVSGEVIAVNRGEKRKVLSIVVKPDGENLYEDFGKKNISALSETEIKEVLLNSGLWSFIKQRPYDIVARPNEEPRDIFVPAFYSAPLAPNFDYIVKGQEDDFQTGLEALAKLTKGKLYVGLKKGSEVKVTGNNAGIDTKTVANANVVAGANTDATGNTNAGIEVFEVDGPHPAGNVGVQINNIKPVNKGDVVWTVRPDDVIIIGRLFNKGITDFTRLIALTGSEVAETGYIKAIAGCKIDSLLEESDIIPGNYHYRIISGNVLTGTKVGYDDYLGAYDNQITVIPEGDDKHEFFGWASLGFNKFTVSSTFASSFLKFRNKEYVIDARLKGGRRAMIMSNEYDQVFPMDIFPEYLLKAIIAFDIDKMENLGIYEVAPEDFALCEVVDTSKIEIQKIVRDGLNLLYKEMN